MHPTLLTTVVLAFVTSALAQAPSKPADATPDSGAVPAAQALAIPPDADGATKALVDSPRHGEWVDVAMPAAAADGTGAAIRTWVSYPERSDRAPVVLVVHEIFGMTDWVRAVADQLAAEGFIAVAPDLLSGKGPNGGGTSSFEGDKVREAIRALGAPEVAQRLDAVRAYAIALPSARAATACIGFCWGGSTTFAYATAQKELRGAIVYYGTAPQDKDGLTRIACPVLGLYGGDDARVTSTVEPTATIMRELGKTFTSHVYPGAGHGFLRQQTGRDGKNLEAASNAWQETIAFLRTQLESRGVGAADER